MADRIVTLCTREEVDGRIEVALRYDAIFELRSKEMLCAVAGIERRL